MAAARSVLRDVDAVRSIERQTAVYAAQIVADMAMALTFTANTICCATIFALVQYKRRTLRRADYGCACSAEVQEPACYVRFWVAILLQNSKVAAVKIFGENLKRKEVDDSQLQSRYRSRP